MTNKDVHPRDLSYEEQVDLIMEGWDGGRLGIWGGYPSDYRLVWDDPETMEKGTVWIATLSGAEMNEPQLIAQDLFEFLKENEDYLDEDYLEDYD